MQKKTAPDFSGLVHIYYGDGKGKTTAALGLALRCLGYGMPVVAAQFLKGMKSGEGLAAEKIPGLVILQGNPCEKFLFQMDAQEKAQLASESSALLERAFSLCRADTPSLLILDEVIDACSCGLLPEDALIGALRSRPACLEVVLTGHSLPEKLAELGDYISHIEKKRHPFDRGVPARRGIER